MHLRALLALPLALALSACADPVYVDPSALTSGAASAPVAPTGDFAATSGTDAGGTTFADTGSPDEPGPWPKPCGGPPGLQVFQNSATGTEWTLPSFGVWEPLLTVEAPYCGAALGNKVAIDVVAEARSLTADPSIVDLRIIDLDIGEGSPVATRLGAGPSAASGFRVLADPDYSRSLVWSIEYAPALEGKVRLQLQAKSSTNGSRLRDVRLSALVP